jgi:hypothetical protein
MINRDTRYWRTRTREGGRRVRRVIRVVVPRRVKGPFEAQRGRGRVPPRLDFPPTPEPAMYGIASRSPGCCCPPLPAGPPGCCPPRLVTWRWRWCSWRTWGWRPPGSLGGGPPQSPEQPLTQQPALEQSCGAGQAAFAAARVRAQQLSNELGGYLVTGPNGAEGAPRVALDCRGQDTYRKRCWRYRTRRAGGQSQYRTIARCGG